MELLEARMVLARPLLECLGVLTFARQVFKVLSLYPSSPRNRRVLCRVSICCGDEVVLTGWNCAVGGRFTHSITILLDRAQENSIIHATQQRDGISVLPSGASPGLFAISYIYPAT